MVSEFFAGFGILIAYFVICVICLLLFRMFIKVPRELFRKMLHMVLLCSIFVFVYGFDTWWVSALAAIVFIIIVYPILALAEKKVPAYSKLLTERKHGELKRSLIVVFAMFAVITSVCWGWMGEQLLILACIFAWGFGDAAAALVGKRFGRRFLQGKLIEGRKSMEGTFAMFTLSLLSVLIVLLFRGGLRWYAYIITSVLTAAACAAVELYTKDGFDTITCPFAAAAVIIPCLFLFGGASV